jgi:DNA (cytosine-5)-methyltransferase 1
MEVLGSIYTGVTEKFQRGIFPIARCVKAEQHDLGVVLMEVIQIGNIAEEKNFSNPQTGRIYDVGGCSPTLNTMQGGNREPKVIVEELGFMDNGTGKHQSNTVYNENGLSPSITTITGGGTQQIKIAESKIVAMRGRNPDNPSDRSVGIPTEQMLEPNMSGTSNCLKSVQKDNLVLEPKYRIRKLTPRECGRLMGVSDEDISKMAAVNSNTQLYKQFGNSIVVDVMCAMFKNLNIEQGTEIKN